MKKSLFTKVFVISFVGIILLGNNLKTVLAQGSITLYDGDSLRDVTVIATGTVCASFSYVDGKSVTITGTPTYTFYAHNSVGYNYNLHGITIIDSSDWTFVSAGFSAVRKSDGIVISSINPTVGYSIYGEIY